MKNGASLAARGGIVIASLLLTAAPTRAAGKFELQAGLHVGYTFGRGWTAGPGLSADRWLASGRWGGTTWDTILVGGIAAAGDLSLAAAGRPAFRVYLGPEVVALYTCPALVLPVGGGVAWSFERERPATFGWQGNLTFLVSRHAMPTYGEPAPSPALLLGASYRVVALALERPTHGLAADARFLFLPGRPGGFGYCGGD